MFANHWVSFVGAPDNREKPPPPPPTPLDFPRWRGSSDAPFAPRAAKDLYSIFSRIQKPTDVSTGHLDALNLSVSDEQELEALVPWQLPNGYRFLPSRDWGAEDGHEDKCGSPAAQPKLWNGRDAPGPEVYQSRKSELTVENGDMFRAVQRLPPLPGRSPVKPGYFHNFWQHLLLVAEFWDTSQEEYFEEDAPRTDESGNDPEPLPKKRKYKGRRTGTGRNMPDQLRELVVRYLMETVTWIFGCQVSLPRLPPRLTLRSSLFAVRLTCSIFRTPADRQRARQGFLEGPLLGVQCRPETCFREPGQAEGTGQAEALDLLREVGVLLLTAQERAREGRTPTKPGEGKWYTTKPRWGGGTGGDIGNMGGNTDEAAAAAAATAAGGEAASSANAASSRDDKRMRSGSKTKSRKQSMADAYKKLQPGSGTWDPKVTYLAIGKEEDSAFDHVFLISSINHHVSILRLKVHKDYISFLETGRAPSSPTSSPLTSTSSQEPPAHHDSFEHQAASRNQGAASQEDDLPWFVLELRRSRWFDLFVAQDRVDVMRGIWGVMAWLTREPVAKDNSEEAQKGRTAEKAGVVGMPRTATAGDQDSQEAKKPAAAEKDEDVIMSD